MKQRTFYIFAIILFAVLSACGPSMAEMDVTTTQIVANTFATLTAEAPTLTPTATSAPTNTPSPTLTPTATSALLNLESFVGSWINEDPNTRGITRIEISRRADNLVIEMWGSCSPTDCAWGQVTTDVLDSDDGILSITWIPSFAARDQQILLLRADGRLLVVTQTSFTDSSGRPDYDAIEYFVRE